MLIRAPLLALATFALLAACDTRPEDFGRARSDTTAFYGRWHNQLTQFSTRRDALFDRAGKVPAGTAGLTEVLSQLVAVKAQVDDLETKISTIRDDAGDKLDARHRLLAEQMLADGDSDLKPLIAGLGAQLDQADSKLTAAEQAAAATAVVVAQQKAAAETAPPPTPAPAPTPAVTGSLTSPDFAFHKGMADVEGLQYLPGTAQLDPQKLKANKALLDPLVTFATTCPQLRFDIIGHSAKDGDASVNQRLSQARAIAIEAYLEGSGVPKLEMSRVFGVGGTQPLVDEPEPGSADERGMQVDQLAKIRDVNRRISIAVVSPCPPKS